MNERTVPTFALENIMRGEQMEELRRCASEQGVFYLEVNGPLNDAHVQAGNAAMTFFANADDAAKQAVTNSRPNMRRGFSPLGSESTARCTNTGEYSDYAMVYSMGISGNLFPTQDFQRLWSNYFDIYYAISQQTAKAVLRSMDVHLHTDIDTLLDCDPVLRFRYFPDVPEDRCAEQQPNRMAPHYDLSIVSLILQTPCPNGFVSLQVELDGHFVELAPRPGCVVVFCGSIAPLVSDGKIKAPQHRVVSPSRTQRIGSNRTSSVLFLRPRSEFTFSVPLAKALGMGDDLSGERATFGEWCGANYMEMHVMSPQP
ncbi:2OG-Fe(II) oxygenase family protein [Xanthomonas sp. 3498]|uniref:2OG-Fe(II) oxygenase family protein n=1 Tax=Xanthomonas sp. 3498 TaxID=2663863 RepID=UPI001837F2B2|nr:2OG-Fe(II) oxygenase family protein [Xanthomonas sp. 3498]MBB5877201.1 deacetoxycephalosporin-C synthase/deacetoxycephalosporin-C hydroxylase [Xanthomonas sp. 3498]